MSDDKSVSDVPSGEATEVSLPEGEQKKINSTVFKKRALLATIIVLVTGLIIVLVVLFTGRAEKQEEKALGDGITQQQNIYGTTWLSYGGGIYGLQGAANFGESVDLSGDAKFLAVGAYDKGAYDGSVTVYQYMPTPTTEWTGVGNTLVGHQGEKFGANVQLSNDGSILIVSGIGSSKFGEGNHGQVSVYEYQLLSNQWVQIGDSVQGEYKGDRFGISLSAASNGLSWIAGGDNDRHDENEMKRDGYARVYELIQGQWVQKGSTIKGSNGSWTAKQHAVEMSGDGQTVCVGENKYGENDDFRPGRARCFRWSDQDDDWVAFGGELIGEKHLEQFGYSLSLNEDGTIVAVSSARYGPGSIKVFELVDGLWKMKGEEMTGDVDRDQMGFVVELNKKGDVLAFSGRGFDSPTKMKSGVVRVRQWINDEWKPLGKDIYGNAEDDYFGQTLILDDKGTTLVSSASWALITNAEYVSAFHLT